MSAISKTTSSTDALPRFGGTALTVVRNRRARALRLSVDGATGAVRLSLPWRQPIAPALAWVETRRAWVEARLATLPGPRPIRHGTTLAADGRTLVVDWSPDRPRRCVESVGRLVVGGPEEALPARVLRHLRAQALALLDRETRALAAHAGLSVTRVSVGDTRSRWGSCATDGHVRYSWRLILAPPHVRASVVAHEVAHLAEPNHGPRFHALADRLLGTSHAPAKRWLAEHGAGLHWVGREG